jgi:hypothetical protein
MVFQVESFFGGMFVGICIGACNFLYIMAKRSLAWMSKGYENDING